MSIAARAGECAEIFDRWLASQTGKELLEQDIQDRMFRFNLWATNNFVFAPTKASMDWRLRNAPLLESTIVELLDDLKANLIKESVIQHHVTTATGLEDEAILDAINETLDGLFRLSRAIRRSGILRRFVKIDNYTEYDENGVNLTAAFRQGAEQIIAFRLKDSKATEALRKRVIDTICLRQQHFSYLRAKKSRNYPTSMNNQSHQSTSRSTLGATYSATGSLASKARKQLVKATAHRTGAGPSIMTATTAQPARMHRAPSIKSESKGKRQGVDCNDTDIPPPPNVPHNLKESECPYCFLVCPKEELSGRKWKSHIIQDLMPYFCVLEPCLTPGSLFESGKDWLGHMRTQHSVGSWTCMDGAHDTTFFFQSKSGFEDHMHQYHPGQFDEGDLNEIAAACYQQLPEEIMIRECPFCPEEQEMAVEPGEMINHVASHLISLSQISLAGHIDGDGSQSEWPGSERFPSYQLSHSGRMGSLAERLETDFQDQIEDFEGQARQHSDYVISEAIPDTDAEQNLEAVWEQIRKPMQDARLDPKLSSFVARFEQEAHEPTANPSTLGDDSGSRASSDAKDGSEQVAEENEEIDGRVEEYVDEIEWPDPAIIEAQEEPYDSSHKRISPENLDKRLSGDDMSVVAESEEADHDADSMDTVSENPHPTSPIPADSHSATPSTGLDDHWARNIFSYDIMSTPIPSKGQRNKCLGEALKGLKSLLNEHRYRKILELAFESSVFRVRFYVREYDYKARIVCKRNQKMGQSEYFCLPLNLLEVVRDRSCLELCRRRHGGTELVLWANLDFTTIEGLVLFFCLFLALRSQDSTRQVKKIRDYELEGEEELFRGQLKDDDYLHDLRVYRDTASGVVRLQASIVKGEMENTPVWTAFITQHIGTEGWIYVSTLKVILLRSLHKIVFTSSEYKPPKTPQGDHILEFIKQTEAVAFVETIAFLAGSTNRDTSQELSNMGNLEEQALRPETPTLDSTALPIMDDPPLTPGGD